MLEQRIAAVLAGLEHAGVGLGAEREPVGPVDPGRAKRVDGLGDVARVALAVLAERDPIVRRRFDDAGDPGRAPAVEDGGVLGAGDPRGRPRRARPGRRPRRRDRRPRAPSGRPRTAPAARPARERAAAAPRRPPRGLGDLLGPPEVGRRVLPAVRAGEVDQLAGGERGRQPLAGLGVEQVPARLGDRRLLAQQVAHRVAPAAGRRCPSDSLPASGAPRAACVLGRLLLGLLAVLDDVALLEEDPLGDLAPQRRAAQQELQVHAEVLELLALGVAHDRPRLAIGLDRHPLLVPADRLRLLGQRRAEAGEGPGLGGQLLGRLVVLVESHGDIFSGFAARGAPIWTMPLAANSSSTRADSA